MGKRILVSFFVIVSICFLAVVGFVQSARFAKIVRSVLEKNVPSEWGIQGDFTDLRVTLFPPAISIENPKVTLAKNNIVNLPTGSGIQARRIQFRFYPFQLFTGNIRVHEAVIEKGDVRLVMDPSAFKERKKRPKRAWSFSWEELLEIQAEAVVLEDTRVYLKWTQPEIETEFVADKLRVVQRKWEEDLFGIELEILLKDMQAKYPKDWNLPHTVDRLEALFIVHSKGVELKRAAITTADIRAVAQGRIEGNILQPDKLLMKSQLSLRGKFAQILKEFQIKEDAGGEVQFDGQVEGDLTQFKKTIRADGSLVGTRVKFQKWEADHFKARGKWSPPDVLIQEAVFTSEKRERSGGFHPGAGGTVKIGEFKLSLEDTKPITIPVQFEDAHIHWVGAPALKDVYPLMFRVSGPLNLEFALDQKRKTWRALADVDFNIPHFQLDNQRLSQNKPLSKVLAVPNIKMKGRFSVNPQELVPEKVLITTGASRFEVTGKLDFKKGWDIRGDSDVDFTDIGQIAETDIRGLGALKVHVHGPSTSVLLDFDADLKEVTYLNMELGEFKGRIRWDDKPEDLIFQNIRLVKGQTPYTANGKIALGDHEQVGLSFSIDKGNIHDLIAIFRRMTEGLSWFPSSLSGEVNGTVGVKGGLSTNALEVMSNIEGRNWDFFGEKFGTVRGKLGFDKGRYFIQDGRIQKYRGGFHGSISYGPNEAIEWDLVSKDLSLNDFDHIGSLDVPVRGSFFVSSNGKGKLGLIDSKTQMNVAQAMVRGVPYAPSDLTVISRGNTLVCTGSANGGEGKLELAYGFQPGHKSSLKIDLKHFNFSPVLLVLNSGLMRDPDLSAFASGHLHLDFQSGAVEYGDGNFSVNEYFLGKKGAQIKLASHVSAQVKDGYFELPEMRFLGNTGEARVTLKSRNTGLDGDISGTMDIILAEFFTSSIQKSRGLALLDFHLGGKLKSPDFTGQVQLKDGEVYVPSLDSLVENISGIFQLKQNLILVKRIEGRLAGGTILTTGDIELFTDRYPSVDLNVDIANNRLRIFPFQYAKTEGKLHVYGEKRPYLVDGDVIIDSALIREKILKDRTEAKKDARFLPGASASQDSDNSLFRLNIFVTADRGILIKNDLFDAEVKAKVRLVNTPAVPRLLGDVDLIRGSVIFKDQDMQIQSAKVVFDSPTTLNPQFNLLATTEVKSTKIRLFASGRMDQMKVELTSDPALPESEILSLLALGFTSGDLQKLNAADQSALQQSGAASLLLHSFDFNRDVREKTGLEIQLEESVNEQSGTSIFRSQTETDTNAMPKLVIKRKIGKRVDVSVGSTVGVGTGSEREVNAEVHVTPGMSVIGVWNTFEGVKTKEEDQSYGLDLKFQKRFK